LSLIFERKHFGRAATLIRLLLSSWLKMTAIGAFTVFELSLYQLKIVQQFSCEYIAFSAGKDAVFDVFVDHKRNKFRVLDSDHVDIEDFWRSPRIFVAKI
jgi:hypothetical protein